jgi:hypothetical protein
MSEVLKTSEPKLQTRDTPGYSTRPAVTILNYVHSINITQNLKG